MFILEIIFWASLALVSYTLFVYPLITLILSVLVNKKVDKAAITPMVSFIIAAYNEEKDIAAKLEQTLKLDYPADKLEIIVASDGSTDRTDEIVRSFADKGVKLNRVEGRKGKTNTLNETVKVATGDILIFSDATGIFNDQSIRELVSNFNDRSVGCVTGRVAYNYGKDPTSEGFKGYQKLAVAIRRAESRFGSQTSVSGSIHAIRRSLFVPSPISLSPDVLDAAYTAVKGYRVVYENNAISLEQSREKLKDEFRCRIRMGVRGLSVIPYVLKLVLGGHKFSYAWQLISHKILRWTLWLWLVIAFLSNMVLLPQGGIYLIAGLCQIAFYSIGSLSLLLSAINIKVPFLSSLALFLACNTAMGIGFVKGLTGKRMGAWEPVR